VVRKYATGLGLDRGYSAHPMRATFITAALENGAQLKEVSPLTPRLPFGCGMWRTMYGEHPHAYLLARRDLDGKRAVKCGGACGEFHWRGG
jgi:hypothetical protein